MPAVSDSTILQSNNYRILKQLGSGSYGEVHLVRERNTRDEYAVKKIFIDHDEEGIPCTALREICLTKKLSETHDNIVRIESIIYTTKKLFIVMEYCQYDLKKLSDLTTDPLHPLIVQSFLHQLLLGIDHCHSNRCIHRDLKPQNILINSAGTLKIADFGLARAFKLPFKTYTHEVVTLWYRCPEILLGVDTYDTSVDLWSVGIIFVELLTKKQVFKGKSEIDQLFKMFKVLGTPNTDVWPGCTDLPYYKKNFPKWKAKGLTSEVPRATECIVHLIENLVTYIPKQRLSALDALSHPYFADYRTNIPTAKRIFQEKYMI